MSVDIQFRIKAMQAFKPPYPILPWEWVTPTYFNDYYDCVSNLQRLWLELLADTWASEHQYHAFLANYPQFFIIEKYFSHFVISELRLGADYVVDLVVPFEDGSRGIIYKLIELESPHTQPFTRKGDPSSRLSHALGQISDWRRWLTNNSQRAEELFPCSSPANFTFEVVIGTRENSRQWLGKRNAFAKDHNVDIRSFDYFSAQSPVIGSGWDITKSAEERFVPLHLINALSNPFYSAYSDADWRAMLREFVYVPHFIEFNADILLKYRSYDDQLLREFLNYCSKKEVEVAEKVSWYNKHKRK